METFALGNPGGMEVRFIALGGIIVSLRVPDRNGVLDDVVLGFDRLDEYMADTRYVGALIGRYANRIARSRFTVDGSEFTVTPHPGPHHLHGGRRGFHKAMWCVAVDEARGGQATRAVLTHTSADGDEGYPGALEATVTYTVTPGNELVIDYEAVADQATPVSLTQHSYFNLAGHDRGDVLGHMLTLNASRFTPVDSTLVPTGELRSVVGTPFDFLQPRAIGSRIEADDEQLAHGHGYDHNFVIDRDGAMRDEPVIAARLDEPRSGRTLELFTTEPGLQLYSGSSFGDKVVGKQWRVYRRNAGVALEPQRFPDSPNQPHFPSATLRPGERYRSRTIYRFSVRSSA